MFGLVVMLQMVAMLVSPVRPMVVVELPFPFAIERRFDGCPFQSSNKVTSVCLNVIQGQCDGAYVRVKVATELGLTTALLTLTISALTRLSLSQTRCDSLQ